jgi:hypothetical protein
VRVKRADPIPDLKRQVALELVALLDGWDSADAGGMIGADGSRVRDIRAGRLDRFSLEALICFVCRLRHTAELRFVKLPPQPAPIRQRPRPVGASIEPREDPADDPDDPDDETA